MSEDQKKKKKKRIRFDDDDAEEEEEEEEKAEEEGEESHVWVLTRFFSLGETTLLKRVFYLIGDVVATRKAQARAVVPRRQH